MNEVFDLAFRFVTETNENIFLTGKAGTGKTTFLKYLKEHCTKNIIVAAPTGVAAINASGVTLHSLFQLPFHPFVPTAASKNELLQRLRFNRRRLQLLRKMDLLVIDEISMVRCDTLDAIDTILRHVRARFHQPFGGVQMLFIGDLYQLPPVANRNDQAILQEFYNTEFFFDSQVIRNEVPVLIELQKIFRQREGSFVDLLNKVRNNQLTADDFDELHKRYIPDFRPADDEKYITLTSHNLQADQINTARLQTIGSKSYTYAAEITGEFPESMFPAESTLELKVGAQVMFLKNDVEKKYFNGKIGIIQSLFADEITVNCDGEKITVQPETWENMRYTLNQQDGKLQEESLGSFTQFPLRLAWAITIHKSQGLTFDKVMIDAGRAFSSGQVYVALSRCTHLDGIVLLSKISSSAIHCNDAVVKCHQSLTPKISLAERFAGARQVFTLQLLEELFTFTGIKEIFDSLTPKMQLQAEKLSADSMAWVVARQRDLLAARDIGLRFMSQVSSYMREEPVIEKNASLQQRVTDAANHFRPILISLKDALLHMPVVTEHREVSSAIDDPLNELLQAVLHHIYLLEFCKEKFSVSGFQQHKLRYATPKISISIYASRKREYVDGDVANPELFDTLKRWRNMICEDHNIPIYMVANQQSLKEIATWLPQSRAELMLIKGFGKNKVERFGDDILDMVTGYCTRHNIGGNMEAMEEKRTKKQKKTPAAQKVPTHVTSFNLYQDGKSLEEIAKEQNMTVTTIEGHLSRYIASGLANISDFVSPDQQRLILEAADKHGWSNFKDIKNSLPPEITYGQLKMVRASLQDEPGQKES